MTMKTAQTTHLALFGPICWHCCHCGCCWGLSCGAIFFDAIVMLVVVVVVVVEVRSGN